MRSRTAAPRAPALGRLALLLVGLVCQAGLATEDDYALRLAVVEDAAVVEVAGRGLVLRDGDLNERLLAGYDGSLRLRAEGDGIGSDRLKVRPRAVLISANGPVRVEGRDLVGQVEVRRAGRGLLVVNRLPLERYLAGLVGVEMSESWPLEALKAQAVAARTYSLLRRLQREDAAFDLATSTLDQVYRGIGREGPQTRLAVQQTAGWVLVWGHLPAETLYHSCCGGRTRAAEEVFGTRVEYLRPVDDPDCAACPQRSWTIEIGLEELGRLLGLGGAVREVKRDPQGTLELRGPGTRRLHLTARELRERVGERRLPSERFTWEVSGASLRLTGTGRGHGVGLCQWGARGMAEKGADFRAILARFYPGCELRKLY